MQQVPCPPCSSTRSIDPRRTLRRCNELRFHHRGAVFVQCLSSGPIAGRFLMVKVSATSGSFGSGPPPSSGTLFDAFRPA